MTRLSLHAATYHHIPYMLRWVQDRQTLLMWSGTRFNWPLTAKALSDHMRRAHATPGQRHLLLGVHRMTGAPIAYGEIIKVGDGQKRHGRLARIIVDPTQRGQGYGVEFVRMMLAYAFDQRHMDLVDLYVFLSNGQAIACYRCVGFREWDIMVQAFRGPQGELFDLLKMGVRRSEWMCR